MGEVKKLKNMTGFPKKDTGYLLLIASENPTFMFEIYDYRGLFVGYMGEKKISINNIDAEKDKGTNLLC